MIWDANPQPRKWVKHLFENFGCQRVNVTRKIFVIRDKGLGICSKIFRFMFLCCWVGEQNSPGVIAWGSKHQSNCFLNHPDAKKQLRNCM